MSVIIIHHNEARSALTRTVWSVINRTPKELLAEIILVDDCSDRENLRDFLEHHFETVELRIMKLRSEKRIGLVGARLLGAERATVILFIFINRISIDETLRRLQAAKRDACTAVAQHFTEILKSIPFTRAKCWHFWIHTAKQTMAGQNHYSMQSHWIEKCLLNHVSII